MSTFLLVTRETLLYLKFYLKLVIPYVQKRKEGEEYFHVTRAGPLHACPNLYMQDAVFIKFGVFLLLSQMQASKLAWPRRVEKEKWSQRYQKDCFCKSLNHIIM